MLTDAHCKNASCSPGAKRVRLADAGCLYLEVSPAGSKRWFWKYRVNFHANLTRKGVTSGWKST